MRAALGLEIAVGVRPFDGERGASDARFQTGSRLDDLGLEAVSLGPPQIHPNEHLRPVRGVRSTDAGGDRDDGVALVIEATELSFQARLVDLGAQLLQLALEV